MISLSLLRPGLPAPQSQNPNLTDRPGLPRALETNEKSLTKTQQKFKRVPGDGIPPFNEHFEIYFSSNSISLQIYFSLQVLTASVIISSVSSKFKYALL